MKDFAKSIVCNSKAVATKVGNAPYKGAKPNYNGVSDSELKSWLRMAEQDLKDAKRDMDKANHDYRGAEITERDKVVGKYAEQIYEANRVIYNITEELKERERNKHGNTRTGNSYSWTQRRGHQELYDPAIPFGGHVRGYVEKSKNGYTGAKTNGPIVIEQKEFATEAEAKKFVENKQTGNKKVGNAAKTFSGKYLDIYDNGTVVVKEGWAFGEKASVNTFERWLDYNIQAKEKVLKETKAMKEEFKKNFI